MLCSRRVNKADIRADQKWDFISLNDFKSTSWLTPLAYGYLLLSLLISIAVYAVDVFTAVNLLAFNRWSGEIEPIISIDISKWIFSACIIASFVNLAYEYVRALRVMRRGAVAESYLDSLAVRLECIRMGEKGRGWKRFLVFAELTKSKKGAEYVALFTYFSFQAWIRVIICQGPQKVINALTLWSVFKANLDPTSASNVGQGFLDFFKKIGILASQNYREAVILCGMAFTLVIWVFAFLSLIIALLFYLFFLWHYIPNRDGGLSGYCERKINTRLAGIVSEKVNKALEDEERKRRKEDLKSARKGEKPALGRQATLPTLFDAKEDKLPSMPMLNRNDTTTTLPMYSSRPGTPSSALPAFELNDLEQRRPLASRTGTGGSYNSRAPLLGNASEMGFEGFNSPAPPLPTLDADGLPLAPQRSMTNNSINSPWNRGFPTGLPRGPPRMPAATGDRGYTESPVSYADGGNRPSPPMPMDSYGGQGPRVLGDLRSNTPGGPAPSIGPRSQFDGYSTGSRSSPAPSGYGSSYGRSSPPASLLSGFSRSPPPTNGSSIGYVAYNPNQRSASAATPSYPPGPGQQSRSMTDPAARDPPSDYFSSGPQRSATDLVDGAMNGARRNPNITMVRDGPARLASPAPYVNNVNGRGSPARLASPAPYVNNMNGRSSPQVYTPGPANSGNPPRGAYRG